MIDNCNNIDKIYRNIKNKETDIINLGDSLMTKRNLCSVGNK